MELSPSISTLYLTRFNLIETELIKSKGFFSFKQKQSSSSRPIKHSHNINQNTYDNYNECITKLFQHRLLILQLLHFECILSNYLRKVSATFHNQSNLGKQIILTNLQSLLQNYYCLLLKLSHGKT